MREFYAGASGAVSFLISVGRSSIEESRRGGLSHAIRSCEPSEPALHSLFLFRAGQGQVASQFLLRFLEGATAKQDLGQTSRASGNSLFVCRSISMASIAFRISMAF